MAPWARAVPSMPGDEDTAAMDSPCQPQALSQSLSVAGVCVRVLGAQPA